MPRFIELPLYYGDGDRILINLDHLISVRNHRPEEEGDGNPCVVGLTGNEEYIVECPYTVVLGIIDPGQLMDACPGLFAPIPGVPTAHVIPLNDRIQTNPKSYLLAMARSLSKTLTSREVRKWVADANRQLVWGLRASQLDDLFVVLDFNPKPQKAVSKETEAEEKKSKRRLK